MSVRRRDAIVTPCILCIYHISGVNIVLQIFPILILHQTEKTIEGSLHTSITPPPPTQDKAQLHLLD